ncbi:MAG: hypothetical protein FJW88_09610 [Actinobacteria bacterium]|nr:hypothetical protein [Actinomycetota bacterium]
MDEQSVTVAPGRVLGYREYGDPAGRPVVSCHGGLVSGLDAAPLEEAARAAAVRELSDPGLARATAAPLAHLAATVEEYRARSSPSGFGPGGGNAPTPIWQGSADTLVPSAWGGELARRIPGARFVLRDDEGHFTGFHH